MPLPEATMLSAISSPAGPGMSPSRTATSQALTPSSSSAVAPPGRRGDRAEALAEVGGGMVLALDAPAPRARVLGNAGAFAVCGLHPGVGGDGRRGDARPPPPGAPRGVGQPYRAERGLGGGR